MTEVITLNATKDQIEELKESVIWLDITNELLAWKEGFERELRGIADEVAETNASTASVLIHLGDINGRIKAVDYMLSILDIFLQILEDRTRQKELNDERET